MAQDVFCSQHVPDYVQQDCGVERAGIIGFAVIDKSLSPTNANLQDANYWNTMINASPQKIFVVKDTRGEYPGGQPQEEEGFGRDSVIVTGADHSAPLEVQGLIDNRDFWEGINRKKWKLALATMAGLLYYVNIPSLVDARVMNPKSIKALAFWKVSLKWQDFSNPVILNTPDGVFSS